MTRHATLLVTGASGFVGRHVAAAATRRGHRVLALARHAPPEGGAALDLAAPDAPAALDALLDGVDAVIHAAAALGGDEAAHRRDTVAATGALVAALLARHARGNAPALVLVSSIAVYDHRSLPEGGLLDEDTALEPRPGDRDAYCRAKLAQEALAREAAAAGLRVWILRPGIVFGPGRLRNAHLGPSVGPVLLRTGGGALPVCAVGRCAEALVLAAEQSLAPEAGGAVTVNVLDDDLPDRARFVAALRASGWPGFVLPCPWRLLLAAAIAARTMARAVPGAAARLPGLLRPAVVHARLKPLRYDGTRLATLLAPGPQPGFETALARALAASEGAHG